MATRVSPSSPIAVGDREIDGVGSVTDVHSPRPDAQLWHALPVPGLIGQDTWGPSSAVPGRQGSNSTASSRATVAVLRRRASYLPSERKRPSVMDGVRVHYNSPEPAKLHARAFTRGSDIHLGPGQEHALPHEAWHVVQQREGRVRPDGVINGIPVSLDKNMENEAAGHATKRPSGLWDTVVRPPDGPVSADVAQLLIISPPASSLDTIITLAIYQQLRSGTDNRVATFDMFRSGGLDMSKEKAIHIQGHGDKLGIYEGVASGLAIGAYLKDKVPEDIMICLDYCFSHMAASDVKKEHPKARIFANKTPAVTQNTGQVFARADPVPVHKAELANELGELVSYILNSDNWKSALSITRALKSDLGELQSKRAETVESVTELFLNYGSLIWGDVGAIYGFLYEYNEILKDEAAKTVL